jgi:hypothetical protein
MAGVMQQLSAVDPEIIDIRGLKNGFRMAAPLRRKQGAGAGSAICSPVVSTFDDARRPSGSSSRTTPPLAWEHASGLTDRADPARRADAHASFKGCGQAPLARCSRSLMH